jgi:hypothetical protein
MPGKSKHGKGKRPQNKNKARQPMSQPTVNAAGTVAPMAATTASIPFASAARASRGAAAKIANAKAMVYNGATKEQYPFFTSELKRIGIITAVILIILIVVSLVIK